MYWKNLLCSAVLKSRLHCPLGCSGEIPKLLWGICRCRFQKQLPQVWKQHKIICSATLQVSGSRVQRGCLCACGAAALVAWQTKLVLSESVLETAICEGM